jgi:hypothetical protein
MKVQIAIIAGGLAIAAGVAYAELKPASPTQSPMTQAPVTQTPTPQQPQPAPTLEKNSPTKRDHRLSNPDPRPQQRDGEGEGREGDFSGGEED